MSELRKCSHCERVGRFYRDEPSGYVAWHEWAERMSKTHHQERCPECGRLTIWRLGPAAPLGGGE